MKMINKSWFLWILAIIITLTSVIYQRKTGPTYPVTISTEINGKTLNNKLIRSWGEAKGAVIKIHIPDNSYTAFIKYKRYKSHDEWTSAPMIRNGEYLSTELPELPPAGKIMYSIILKSQTNTIFLTEEPVILRYKGSVPDFVLIPHIILVFFAMLLSTRTGLEAVSRRKDTYKLSLITLILFLVGGMILGPLVQKYAFGAFWAGWPVGNDLTDNKSAVAFLFWLIAFFRIRNNPKKQKWVLIASIVMLVIYLIPHSMMGSEIDFTETKLSE